MIFIVMGSQRHKEQREMATVRRDADDGGRMTTKYGGTAEILRCVSRHVARFSSLPHYVIL